MSDSREPSQRTKECVFLEGVLRRCPGHLPTMEALGDLYTRMGRIDEGLAIDESLTAADPRNPTYAYNLACSLALVGQKEKAIEALTRAVQLGYDDLEWLLKDSDLDSLRKHPHFVLILVHLKSARKNSPAS
ncbi:MAG TPA: hypothetical protein PKC67_10885 [Kiritimatiellia bacterium]|nr:hypothetical protein [Kiritimatiellia bacterium]HMP34844.1 hypothetical protein [Kiritimatiellia bacterium]